MKIVKYFYEKPSFTEVRKTIYGEYGIPQTTTVLSNKPNKRLTACGIYDSDTNVLSIGITICSPNDTFIKDVGKKLAYERAVSNPIMRVNLLKGERVSDVFFDLARDFCKRYSSLNTVTI